MTPRMRCLSPLADSFTTVAALRPPLLPSRTPSPPRRFAVESPDPLPPPPLR